MMNLRRDGDGDKQTNKQKEVPRDAAGCARHLKKQNSNFLEILVLFLFKDIFFS